MFQNGKVKSPVQVTTPRGPPITTLRPSSPRVTPTPVPRAPGSSDNSPNFAHFQATGSAGASTPATGVRPTRRPRVRGSKKRRQRLRAKTSNSGETSFVPTPPSAVSRERIRSRPRPSNNVSPAAQTRLPSFNSVVESTRSNLAQNNKNFIDLEELAGVKELEAALKERDQEISKLRNQDLRQRESEIQKLKTELRDAEQTFQVELSQQSRQLNLEAAGKVEELERSLREKTRQLNIDSSRVEELELSLSDQTRRLADTTKKTFDLEQTVKDLEKELRSKERLLRDKESTVKFQTEQLKDKDVLENKVMDYQKELKLRRNDIEQRERKIKELEQLTKKQDQVTLENVQKIQLIESTIDEVEQIVLSKDQIIKNLKTNIEEFRSNSDKDGAKIHDLEIDLDQRTREVIDKDRKLRELQQEINNLQLTIEDRQEDIEELNNRTRLHLEYEAEKQKEITQLETAVETLKNTTISKDAQIISIGQQLKQQIDVNKLKVKEIEKLNANITKSVEIIANREQKVFTLEAAVTSLKGVVEGNNINIATLNKGMEQMRLEIGEKDKFIQAQREKLTQSSQSIKDLQELLGDAGKTIDNKNKEIEELTSKVEAFKFDKKNLLGIVQQLATIGNPGINLKNLGVLDTTQKSARLVAQESQRSVSVAKKKDQTIKSKRKIPPHRRSFVHFGSNHKVNSIESVSDATNKEVVSEITAVNNDNYATTEFDDNNQAAGDNIIAVDAADENIQTKDDKEAITASTTVTSYFDSFPSFIDLAQKVTTALPTLFTSTTTTPATSTTTTASPSTPAPVSLSSEIFTVEEAIFPTESSSEGVRLLVTPAEITNNDNEHDETLDDNIDTISAPAATPAPAVKSIRGRLVHGPRKLGAKILGERRKLFGQRTLYY